MSIQHLSLKNKSKIAYQQYKSTNFPKDPGLVFLHGLKSDMNGSKSTFLLKKCQEQDVNFLCFDNLGHGLSSGNFLDQTMGAWFETACEVLQTLTSGPQIVVGSSMGGWLMLLLARHMPEKVKALVGIASAPDFLEDLMWKGFSEEQKRTLLDEGILTLPYDWDGEPYRIRKELITEAREHLVFTQSLPLTCPVRLIHGLKDDVVPYSVSVRLANHLENDNTDVFLLKDGDHYLSRTQDLHRLWSVVQEVC